MQEGALHTIITDGVWYPQRAVKRATNADGKRVLCKQYNAGLQHIWWECPAMNSVSNLGWLHLEIIRANMNAQPECLWATGVINKDWTSLEDTEHMSA
eukprot:4254291-Heterocapsa_arctica.AAC.1